MQGAECGENGHNGHDALRNLVMEPVVVDDNAQVDVMVTDGNSRTVSQHIFLIVSVNRIIITYASTNEALLSRFIFLFRCQRACVQIEIQRT